MTVCKIENDKVVQVWKDVKTLSDFTEKYDISGLEFIEGDGRPGQLWDGTTFSDPVPTAGEIRAQMQTLTVYQLAIAAFELNHITEAEAKGWVKGVLPAKAQAAIANIPDPKQKFRAEIMVMAPTNIARLSPNIAILASPQGFNLTDEQVDAIFALGAEV